METFTSLNYIWKNLLTLAFDDNLEKYVNLLNTWAKMTLSNRITLFKKDKVQKWK